MPTDTATIVADTAFRIEVVDPLPCGSSIERLGRAGYRIAYAPGRPTAGAPGVRRDVREMAPEVGMTIVRYPGGSVVSGYDGRDGVGRKERCPRRLDLVSMSLETEVCR